MSDDLTKRANLLPINATPLERSIADVDGRLDDIAVEIIRNVRSPEDDPVELLKYLAWERSVDVWDPEWPEDIRRAVVKAAPIVHRFKGTRYAVETALSALNVDTTIIEWWQAQPQAAPYTFLVKAYARARLYDGPVLDDRLISSIFSSILRSKPHSRAFHLVIGATFPRPLGLAPVLLGKDVVRRAAHPSVDAKSGRTLGLAPILLGKVAGRHAVHPVLDARGASTLGLAGAVLGKSSVRASMILRTAS